jgi:hypothetical protein
MGAGHVGLGPGLVDEDEAFSVELGLMTFPTLATSLDVGPILFAGAQAFF